MGKKGVQKQRKPRCYTKKIQLEPDMCSMHKHVFSCVRSDSFTILDAVLVTVESDDRISEHENCNSAKQTHHSRHNRTSTRRLPLIRATAYKRVRALMVVQIAKTNLFDCVPAPCSVTETTFTNRPISIRLRHAGI